MAPKRVHRFSFKPVYSKISHDYHGRRAKKAELTATNYLEMRGYAILGSVTIGGPDVKSTWPAKRRCIFCGS